MRPPSFEILQLSVYKQKKTTKYSLTDILQGCMRISEYVSCARSYHNGSFFPPGFGHPDVEVEAVL